MGIYRAILVFSSTFYIKSLTVTSITGTTRIMAYSKSNQGAKKAPYRPNTAKAPKFKPPTVGLEDVIFEYGTNMKAGSFQGYLDSLSGHMASSIKKGGAQAAKAV